MNRTNHIVGRITSPANALALWLALFIGHSQLDAPGSRQQMIHPTMQHGFYDPFLAACARAGAGTYPTQYAQTLRSKGP